MTNKEILKLKFYSDDLGKEISIKKYLKKLLKKVILETEGFDGKRPFGNSDWIYELAYCLCENEIIETYLSKEKMGTMALIMMSLKIK